METPLQQSVSHARMATVFICVLAALAGLMFGLDIGVISGAVQFIQADFQITDHDIEWIVSAMMLGAAFGALGAGWPFPRWDASARCCSARRCSRRLCHVRRPADLDPVLGSAAAQGPRLRYRLLHG